MRRAGELVRGMSVAQKVGQLFLISFPGNDTAPNSDIADLIVNYKVGGVQLKAANQNFANGPDGVRQIAQLADSLQTLAGLTVTSQLSQTGPFTRPAQAFVPLFIAINQEGDAYPLSEVTQGVTALPSPLTVGSTWQPRHAETVGRILGTELAQLGVNVLLGPSLDVADTSKAPSTLDNANHIFGGDPFWVGKFGSALASGVHQGSRNRLAVVFKSFPGLGSSNRNVEDEIPTVQKSLEQLKQVELAPFFAVTQLDGKVSGGVITATDVADGLLVSHIRYRGFQGNIRASTRPVSLDPQAYQDLMSLAEIAPWRAAGGVTFSDVLGARSVRRFYDPLDTSFNARQIARDAFLAGNDVLNLGAYALNPNSWPEQLANIKDTISFFRERYVSEPAFAARVDAAVTRIVALKLRQYQNNLEIGNIVGALAMPTVGPAAPGPTTVPQPTVADRLAVIARDSLTLISPSPRDLPAILPGPPGKDDAIVFVTDDQLVKECAKCAAYPAIGKTALQDIVLKLYGPRATGQVNPAKVASFTFSELADYGARAPAVLPAPTLTPAPTRAAVTATVEAATAISATEPITAKVQSAIDSANWIIIGMLDMNPSQKPAKALRDFLALRADALRDKRVIVYAFGAPNALDLTEISKVTAYIGVYSRTPASLEAAMKALFGESGYAGASPISVPALNYSLTEQTSPDPSKDIPLFAGEAITRTQSTPGAISLKVGDRLKLRAGPILDRNGRSVPDNTPVQFLLSYPTERVEQQPIAGLTKDGFAEATATIERKGTLFIRAQSDRAERSYIVRVDIGDNSSSIETLRPTPLPTLTIEPTTTPTTIKPTSTSIVTPIPASAPPPPPERASVAGFALTLLALLGSGALAFTLFRASGARIDVTSQMRIILLAWTAGWSAYAACVLGMLGSAPLGIAPGWLGAVGLSLGTCVAFLAGLGIYYTRRA